MIKKISFELIFDTELIRKRNSNDNYEKIIQMLSNENLKNEIIRLLEDEIVDKYTDYQNVEIKDIVKNIEEVGE